MQIKSALLLAFGAVSLAAPLANSDDKRDFYIYGITASDGEEADVAKRTEEDKRDFYIYGITASEGEEEERKKRDFYVYGITASEGEEEDK